MYLKTVCLLLIGVAACAARHPSAHSGGASHHHGTYGISYGGHSSHSGSTYGASSHGGGSYGGSTEDAHATIKTLKSDVRHDGFDYALETSNHIHEQRSGDAYGNVHGNFGWLSKDGVPVHVNYVADENGYQPSSDLLPTPPPIPKEIVKLLEYIRTHPQKDEDGHYGGGQHYGGAQHARAQTQYGHRG